MGSFNASRIFDQVEMQTQKPLAEGKTLPIKPFKELSLFGKCMALMLLKSELSSDQNCANAKHNKTQKLGPHHNAPSACGRNLVHSTGVLRIKASVLDLRIILNAKGILHET